jgi:hypothetical protein
MFGSNDKMPVPAIVSRQAAFSRIGIKIISASFVGDIQLGGALVRNKERRAENTRYISIG